MLTTLVACMRNEAAVLPEWIAYHQAIGVTDFVVFTNDCEDGTDAMLDRMAELGGVHHVPNPRQGKKTVQWKALNKARHHPAVQKADWLGVLDADEFLVIHPGEGKLSDLIDADPDAAGFVLSWRMFGCSGHSALLDDVRVTTRFTRAAPDQMLWPWRSVQHKCLWRNNGNFKKLGVHRPLEPEPEATGKYWVDDRGQRQPWPKATVILHDQPRYGLAQINHYALGSRRDFLLKQERGRPNHTDLPIDLNYWVERDFNDVEDLSILRFSDAIEDGIASMMADMRLRELYEEGLAWKRARLSKLSETSAGFQTLQLLEQLGQGHSLPLDKQRELLKAFMSIRRKELALGGGQSGEYTGERK